MFSGGYFPSMILSVKFMSIIRYIMFVIHHYFYFIWSTYE